VATYEQVHAGDVVIGHDNQLWGVESIGTVPDTGQRQVTLVRHGAQVTGYPPAGTEVTVAQPADVSREVMAAQLLINAGLGPLEILWEGLS
jgi:hypothetical protein